MIHSARLLPVAVANLGTFGGSNGLGGNGVPTSPAAKYFQVISTFGRGAVVKLLDATRAIVILCHQTFLRGVDTVRAENLIGICLPSLKKQTRATWLFLGTASRRVEIDVLSNVAGLDADDLKGLEPVNAPAAANRQPSEAPSYIFEQRQG